jgi:hypothetical protein
LDSFIEIVALNEFYSAGIYIILPVTGLKLVTVKLPEALIEGLDELVRMGMYPSRSAAVRASVRDLLRRELWRVKETP